MTIKRFASSCVILNVKFNTKKKIKSLNNFIYYIIKFYFKYFLKA
jgi:hypothetical protein